MRGEDIKRVAVVGAGIMGHGIALEFALSGYEVHLHDVSAERLQRALDNVQINLGLMAEGGLLKGQQIGAAMENIHTTTSLEEAASDCDWGRMAIVDTKPFKLRVILHRIFVERPQVTGIPAWPGGAACYRRSRYIL